MVRVPQYRQVSISVFPRYRWERGLGGEYLEAPTRCRVSSGQYAFRSIFSFRFVATSVFRCGLSCSFGYSAAPSLEMSCVHLQRETPYGCADV